MSYDSYGFQAAGDLIYAQDLIERGCFAGAVEQFRASRRWPWSEWRINFITLKSRAAPGPKERIYDLEGNDVTDCDYCLAFQTRDWQTVQYMQDHNEGCTCNG